MDSDFDDDDLDDLLVFNIFNDNLGRRRDIFGWFPLNELLEIEVKQFFRFEKQHILWLAMALGIPDEITTLHQQTYSFQAYMLFVFCYEDLHTQIDLENFFVYSYGALSTIINTVA